MRRVTESTAEVKRLVEIIKQLKLHFFLHYYRHISSSFFMERKENRMFVRNVNRNAIVITNRLFPKQGFFLSRGSRKYSHFYSVLSFAMKNLDKGSPN